jgi:hypothetical protein
MIGRFLGLPGACWLLLGAAPLQADGPPTGFQSEVKIKRPTRLDWEFVASGFGPKAAQLPSTFDSRQQRFQLFVPRTYDAKRAWPLVAFISPGDAPLGWRYWQKLCEQHDLLFCAPYAAGNNCPPGQRVRIVLDMLDQVRRDYRIDPEHTYLTGFSGGGRMACTIAFALPEYFSGVIPICGTNPLNKLDYLRHRVHDRLSVALVTGERDFNRVENEKYMFPMLRDLGIRCRLWVVPKMGHAVPGPEVLDEVRKWIDEDLPRRKQDLAKRPTLACPPDDAMTPSKLAARLLGAAEADLKDDERVWRGVSLLRGLAARWPRTAPAEKARTLLKTLQEDKRRLGLAGEQGGKDERTYLRAQARALESVGRTALALRAWQMLAERHADAPEGREAQAAVQRLEKARAATPYLGISFAGESAVVDKVLPGSPADRAGFRAGDRIRTLGGKKVQDLAGLRRALEGVKPGDKVKVELDRQGTPATLTVEVGSPPR